ncbi:MAG: hypothetical protein ACUVQY_11435 [Thermoproteota archaeon]
MLEDDWDRSFVKYCKHGYLSLPLMARPNTIIPVGANDKRPDHDYADGAVVKADALGVLIAPLEDLSILTLSLMG